MDEFEIKLIAEIRRKYTLPRIVKALENYILHLQALEALALMF